MNELINIFIKIKSCRTTLIESQTPHTKKPLCILRPCDTRWSSSYYAALRLQELQVHVNMIHPKPASFWLGLNDVIQLLKPFEVATNVLQSDAASLFTVYVQFVNVIQALKSLDNSTMLGNNRSDALNIIVKYWTKHINSNAIIISAMFNFDDSYKTIFTQQQILAAKNWFVSFAAEYLIYYKIVTTTEKDKNKLKTTVKLQLQSFLRRGNVFVNLSDEIKEMKGHPGYHPKNIWFEYVENANEITQAAIAILSMNATEAAVERSFSTQNRVHSNARNRLLDSSVEEEMMIKFNKQTLHDALNKKSSPPKHYEIAEINIDDDTNIEYIDLFTLAGDEEDDEVLLPVEQEIHFEAEEELQNITLDGDIQEQDYDDELDDELPTTVLISNTPTLLHTNSTKRASYIPVSQRVTVCLPIQEYTNIGVFIDNYITKNKINSTYRWTGDNRMNLVEAARNNDPPIIDTESALIMKIKSIAKNLP
jgi:hypothetical protein